MMNGKSLFSAAIAAGVVGFISFAACGATMTANWVGGGATTLTSDMDNWRVNGERPDSLALTDGTLDVVLDGGDRMTFREGDYFYRITSNIDVEYVAGGTVTPFTIAPENDGDKLVLAYGIKSDQKTQLVLKGHFAIVEGVDYGKAGKNNTRAINYNAKILPGKDMTGMILPLNVQRATGSATGLLLVLDGATIDLPLYLSANSNVSSWMTTSNSVNIINGNFYDNCNMSRVHAEAGSVIKIMNGFGTANCREFWGGGEFQFHNLPMSIEKGAYIYNNTTVSLFAPGNNVTGNSGREGLEIASGCTLSCHVNDALYDTLQIFGTSTSQNTPSLLELNQTTQKVGRLKMAAGGLIRSEGPALLEITGKTRTDATDSKIAILENMGDIVGPVTLHVAAPGLRNDLCGKRQFSSTGDLIVSAGTNQLWSQSSWLNGTNFVMKGDGVMHFVSAGQVSEKFAFFHFAESGSTYLAGNFTLKVRRAAVDNGDGEVLVQPGLYDANSTGLMAGRITGPGKLLVQAYGPETPEYAETTEDMTAQGDWIVETDAGCTHVVTVPQTGNGKIIKSGEGTLIFRTENSYSGGTVIEKGIVRVETNNVFGTGEVTLLGQRADYTGNCRIDMIGWKLKTKDFTTPTVTITNDLHITGSSSRTYPAIIGYYQNARWGGKITAEQDFGFLDDRATTYECAGSYSGAQDLVLSLSFGDVEVKGTMINDGWARFRFDGKVDVSAVNCTIMRNGEGGSSNWKASYHFQDDVSFGSVTNRARDMYFYKKLTLDGAHNLPEDMTGYVQGRIFLTGTESSIGGFSDCEPIEGSDLSKKWLVQPRTGSATLTLTGVEGESELTTHYAFVGALSLTMDAPNFTQIFSGRANTMSGAIWVKNGTMKLTDGTKFANISSLTVEQGAQFIDESGVEGALAGLKNLTLTTGAVLDLPTGTELNLSTLTIDGARAAPGNGYTHEHYPAIPEGVTVNVTSLQPAKKVAVWTGAASDGKMSTLGNWLVNGEVPASLDLTSGTTTVSIEGGTEMIPDIEGIRIHSITNNSTEGTFYVGAAGKTLYVDGAIVSDNKSQFGLRGTIAGAKGGVLQSFAATEKGATVVTCINAGGTNKEAVRFAGVTLMKPAYIYVNSSGNTTYVVENNTTNVLMCAAYNGAGGGNKANVGTGSFIEFAGGLSQKNRPMKQGAGTLKISGVAVAQDKGYNIEGGTLELACPGNVFKAYSDDYNWGIRIGTAADSMLKFDCSYTLADNDFEQINFVNSKKAAIDFGCTTQLVSRFFGNNTHAQSVLTGEVGSMLEVKGGTKWETGNNNFIGLTNSVQITGGLGFHYLGNGPAATKNPIAPAGADDVYVLKGKAFATTGSLEVSGGTLELAADATWRNGACFAANGEGLLRFTAAGQVGAQATFRFAGNGKIEIPAGVTYRCTAIDVEGSEPIETGVFDKDSTGAMAGRIIGDGALKVGRRGTMLIVQ